MTTDSDDNYREDAVDAWQPAINGMDSDNRDDEDDSDNTAHVDEWQSLVAHDTETDEETDEPDEDSDNSSMWLGSFMPDDSDSDGEGRTGVLSTYVEWHALVVGLAVGTLAVQTGQFEVIAAIVGAGAAGSRLQLGLPDKYIEQVKTELPYFIFGVGVAVGGVQLAQLGLLPT